MQGLFLGEKHSPYVLEQIRTGNWRPFVVSPHLTGLTRPTRIFLADCISRPISRTGLGPGRFLPGTWNLAIGSGPCGLGCSGCPLLATFRDRRNPFQPVIYQNIGFLHAAVQNWLKDPARQDDPVLGLGIGQTDSLLYESLIPHVRTLAPLFASPRHNPAGAKLLLQTRTSNAYHLDEIAPQDRTNIILRFDLNPQSIASLWEGRWPDTGESIPPPISARLATAAHAQELGFEVRARLDPILTPEGWQDHYADFIRQVESYGLMFTQWELGTYWQKNNTLVIWRERWSLLPIGWHPEPVELEKDGLYWVLSSDRRQDIYSHVTAAIQGPFPEAQVDLLKETGEIGCSLELNSLFCDCMN